MQFEEAQTQSLIDSKIMEFEMKSRQGLQVNSHHMLLTHNQQYIKPAHGHTSFALYVRELSQMHTCDCAACNGLRAALMPSS